MFRQFSFHKGGPKVMQLLRNFVFLLSNSLLSNGLLERVFDELDLRGQLSFAMCDCDPPGCCSTLPYSLCWVKGALGKLGKDQGKFRVESLSFTVFYFPEYKTHEKDRERS
jgi:hypothetical protein